MKHWVVRNWNWLLLLSIIGAWMIYTRYYASPEVIHYVKSLCG